MVIISFQYRKNICYMHPPLVFEIIHVLLNKYVCFYCKLNENECVDDGHGALIAIIVILAVLVLIIGAVVFFCMIKRRKKQCHKRVSPSVPLAMRLPTI